MIYEAEIRLRRSDPQQLADDFKAVSDFLADRRARQSAQSTPATPERRLRHLELVQG